MKNLLICSLFVLFQISIFAQDGDIFVPENTNDICPVLIGENLPNSKLKNLEGDIILIEETIKDKPTIIVFYRGGWCPYCNSQLAGLNEIESQIDSLGFQVLAISPDTVEKLNETKEKGELKYNLLSDKDMDFAQKVGVAFKVDEKTIERYKKYGIDLEKNKFQLPTPAVFVVDKDGVIQFSYVNPNYKVRLNPDILISVMNSLQVK